MALVRNITKTVDIPWEVGEAATIRKLNHKVLKEAAKLRQSEGVGFMKEVGGELLKALKDEDDDKLKKIQDKQESNVQNYDRDKLLKEGIVSWTYEGKLPEDTDDLDERTAKFLAEQILEFSRNETKEEAKNA